MVAGSSPARGVVPHGLEMGPFSKQNFAIAGGPVGTKEGMGHVGPLEKCHRCPWVYIIGVDGWAMTAVPLHLTLRPLHRDRTASVTETGAGIHVGRRVSRRTLPRLPTRDRVIATGA